MSDPEFIWHGRRFWKTDPEPGEHRGWNTRFEPCWVLKKTARRIQVLSPSFGKLWLNRLELERDGRVYHSRPHEYFYANRPAIDPEAPLAQSEKVTNPAAFKTLGVALGCSKIELRRAYKRLAKKAHPDTGGSHEAFLSLQRAYESASESVFKRG